MGEIQGVGVPHDPSAMLPDADMSAILRHTLTSPRIPGGLRDAAAWPPAMRAEWGSDQGATAAPVHRRRLIEAYRAVRREIEAFRPDFVLIWGADQHENFREDLLPPFCVFVLDQVSCFPFRDPEPGMPRRNIWEEAAETVFTYRGHPAGGRYLARRLLDDGFDVPCAFRVREGRGLARAFVDTLLLLDHDRAGFPLPVVPFHVNAVGSRSPRAQTGTAVTLAMPLAGVETDALAPSPLRCFDLGRAIARILAASPWRVSVVAAGSWSRAQLTDKHAWLYPDIEADRARLAELERGEFGVWRHLSRPELEDAGQHEMLSWLCLAGAMSELGRRAKIVDWVESRVFGSSKCFAVFPA